MSSKFLRYIVLGLLVIAGLSASASHPSLAKADILGYPWYDATTLNQSTYDWGYATCPASDTGCKNYANLLYTLNGTVYGEADPWGYSLRNCTSYTAWRLTSVGVPGSSVVSLGNGGQWYNNAPANEKSLTPAPWDAAVSPSGNHVAFVESVNTDGTITVSEYNHDLAGNGGIRTGTASSMGFTEFVDFGVHPSGSGVTNRKPGDFNGDGVTDMAVFRPSDGTWHVQMLGLSYDYSYGQSGDIPVPGNYDTAHPNVTDIAVFRPSDGYWHIRGVGDYQFGQSGDIPVPGDYNGDGITDIAVYRPSNGMWYVRTPYVGDFQFGQIGDIPVPGYYNNDNIEDIAVYRPSEGGWHIRGVGDFPYGASTDIPVPGDYNGDSVTDAAVFRPSEDYWHVNAVGDYPYGASADIPVPGFYGGNATENIAVYRPSEGGWHIRGVGDYAYGTSTDIPAVQTLNAFLLKQYGLISSY